jgi:hypothetical protein
MWIALRNALSNVAIRGGSLTSSDCGALVSKLDAHLSGEPMNADASLKSLVMACLASASEILYNLSYNEAIGDIGDADRARMIARRCAIALNNLSNGERL